MTWNALRATYKIRVSSSEESTEEEGTSSDAEEGPADEGAQLPETLPDQSSEFFPSRTRDSTPQINTT